MLSDHPHTLKYGCERGVCLVGEKPDKELPGIVGARGDATVSRTEEGTILHCVCG